MMALLLATSVSAMNNSACSYKMFPIFAGGSKTEEVRAVEVDPISQYIFVGGKTDSSNFAPAENPHGYVYAVNSNGDWMWGQFFYNVSYAVSQIDGIMMSQNNTVVNCFGQANNKPIIMNLNKAKGQIQKFFTIDPMEPRKPTVYQTYQGLHFEEKNSEDGQAYYYLTFQMAIDLERVVHVMKFDSNLKLIWHFGRIGLGANNLAVTPQPVAAKDDIPRLLVMDSSNQREFYLMGKFRSSTTVA